MKKDLLILNNGVNVTAVYESVFSMLSRQDKERGTLLEEGREITVKVAFMQPTKAVTVRNDDGKPIFTCHR